MNIKVYIKVNLLIYRWRKLMCGTLHPVSVVLPSTYDTSIILGLNALFTP